MQIVIDIPEDDYKEVLKDAYSGTPFENRVFSAIANGTVLPKHGRLGDLDELEQEMINGIKAGNLIEGYEKYGNINDVDDCVETVRYAPTILEAWGNEE